MSADLRPGRRLDSAIVAVLSKRVSEPFRVSQVLWCTFSVDLMHQCTQLAFDSVFWLVGFHNTVDDTIFVVTDCSNDRIVYRLIWT